MYNMKNINHFVYGRMVNGEYFKRYFYEPNTPFTSIHLSKAIRKM